MPTKQWKQQCTSIFCAELQSEAMIPTKNRNRATLKGPSTPVPTDVPELNYNKLELCLRSLMLLPLLQRQSKSRRGRRKLPHYGGKLPRVMTILLQILLEELVAVLCLQVLGVLLTSPQFYGLGHTAHTDDPRQAIYYIIQTHTHAPLLGIEFSLDANIWTQRVAEKGESARPFLHVYWLVLLVYVPLNLVRFL
jgi:hypothetical protein